MKLSIWPTRIEVYDEDMQQLTAIVQMNDDVTVKVEILQVVGWNDWLNITDAVRKAMHMMHLGEEQHEEAAAELRRLHGVNKELGNALRRLISYCNTLENRLMEADGEHPAMQEAKEAYAKVEGQP